jgi:Zn-finger nucleic acid-binding protein
MKCPECGKELDTTKKLGVLVDYCPKCKGIWLEKGKLDKILEKCEGSDSNDDEDDEEYDRKGKKKKNRDDDDDDNKGGFLGGLLGGD